jgi:hypothetical protein
MTARPNREPLRVAAERAFVWEARGKLHAALGALAAQPPDFVAPRCLLAGALEATEAHGRSR